MKIQLNRDSRVRRIDDAVKDCIAQIKYNANKGTDTTELRIPKDIASTVREYLREKVDNISFLIVESRRNPYTGNIDNFVGKDEGENRFYKVRINA